MEGRKTPLYDEHVALGGKIVEYAGWLLPVQYTGLEREHQAVREKAGLFDVSHMGEVLIEGPDATAFVERLLTNKVTKAAPGRIVYGLMLDEDGYPVDDLLVYKYGDDKYWLVVNAANAAKDVDWIRAQQGEAKVTVTDQSAMFAQLAVQGPEAEEILGPLCDFTLSELQPFHFLDEGQIADRTVIISRTGYTGEDGFEIYCRPEDAVELWRAILEAGEGEVIPAGLGARDTLRFEAGLPLYGHEISPEIDPLEGGLGFFVKLDKEPAFIGQTALKERPLTRELLGLELLGRGMLREGYEIFLQGEPIGVVTTGYLAPTVGKNLANILVRKGTVAVGDEVEVQIRKRRVPAKVIKRQFLTGGKA